VTNFYAVVGNPVSHSRSPQIMNAGFRSKDIDAVYSRILMAAIDDFTGLDKVIGFSGCNVTAPFKKAILKHVSAMDDQVVSTGVANTLVRKQSGWHAFNTDISGALEPVKKRIGALKDKKVLIIGAGGAAKAVLQGLKAEGAQVSIVNRTQSNAEKLARNYNASVLLPSALEVKYSNFDVIFNTTAVVIKGLEAYSPPEKQLLIDANYNVQPFRRFFREGGNQYISGIEWLISQAETGFKIFTDKAVDPSIFQRAMNDAVPNKKGSIVLIGPMGAGKTTTARYLSELSGYDFIDLD
jgi:shikimate dehydrogenase